MRTWLCPLGMLVLSALSLPSRSATAQTHSYRYQLSTKAGDPRFAVEIPTSATGQGRHYEVQTDSLGRITRYAEFENGLKTGEYVYHFDGRARLPNAYDSYAPTGEVTGTTRMQRNGNGEMTRTDAFTVGGELTGYSTASISGDQVEWLDYTAEGKQTIRNIYYYSARGLVIRRRYYPEAETYYESEIDEATGLPQTRKKYVSGELQVSAKYTYDGAGSLTRYDMYTPQGSWYGEKEYVAGLLTRELYKFQDSTTQETRSEFDAKRNAKQATFYVNGKLICTFTYDRLPDGTVKRTLAVGPDGTLLAEYPDLEVNKVLKNGEPVDHPSGAILHTTGDWW